MDHLLLQSPDHLVLVLGGVSFNSVVYLPTLPRPQPHTILGAEFREGVGSTGAGKALALAKLRVRHHLLAAVGQDSYGEQVLADLRDQGVSVEPIWDSAGTERHVNLLDEDGGRISIFIHRASATVACDRALLRARLEAADVVVLNIGAYCQAWIDDVGAAGKPVWVDLHDYDGRNPYYEPFIEVATHIQFSAEATANPQSLMSRFIAQGKAVALCTDGKRGASLMTADGVRLERAAVPGLHVVDSDGAGDAFFVGYLYGWLTKQPPQTCLQMATTCGGYTVTERGLVYQDLSRAWLQQQVA